MTLNEKREPLTTNCSYCGLCLSSCPVFSIDKSELNSPRGLLSMIDFWMRTRRNEGLAEKIFQCLLCGKCVSACPLKINVPGLILRIRRELLSNSRSMEFIKELRGRFKEKGNVLGEPVKPVVSKSAKTLLFKGCVYSANSNLLSQVRELLSSIDLSFTELEREYCCGLILKSLGLVDEFKLSIQKNSSKIRKLDVKQIVTLCPTCHRAFKENYSDSLRDVRILSMNELLLELVEEKSLPLSGLDVEIVYLKDLSEEGETCLKLLSKIPKLRVKEVVEVFSCYMINECNRSLVEEIYSKQISELISSGSTVFISSSPISITILRNVFRGKPVVFDLVSSLILLSLTLNELLSNYSFF